MNVQELVGLASKKAGSGKQLAAMMKKSPSRISEWKSGERKPDAAEIAYMARAAGLPVLITLAFVEKDLHPETAELWDAALGEVKALPSRPSTAGHCILC